MRDAAEGTSERRAEGFLRARLDQNVDTGQLIRMARPKGFEPLAPRFVVWCSIQLSYGRASLSDGRVLPRGRGAL